MALVLMMIAEFVNAIGFGALPAMRRPLLSSANSD